MPPPKPRCCLNVGVTGHRLNRLPAEALRRLAPQVEQLLVAIAERAAATANMVRDFYGADTCTLRLLSGLAEGADRMVAQRASARGYKLHAVLPFAREVFADDFVTSESRQEFAGLLASAERVLELPGSRDAPGAAYEMAGLALLAQADLLIAIWDGAAAFGQGGTSTIVAAAVEQGVPVIHVSILPGVEPRLLWSGLDAAATRTRVDDAPAHVCDRDCLGRVLSHLLAPPADRNERNCLVQFLGERQRLRGGRFEYPLLLAVTGVKRFTLDAWRAPPYEECTRESWRRYREAAQGLPAPVADDDAVLERAYAWSDQLAAHFAQVFRSGHVMNFAFAAIAVLAALAGLLSPLAKWWLALVELALIVAIIVNTASGHRMAWKRRWLDYRVLAERLRPMRSLKRFGLARTGDTDQHGGHSTQRWVDWYAKALWRQMGVPDGRIDAERRELLPRLIGEQEIAPQIAYHRSNAARMRALEHRLHLIGNLLFIATVAGCAMLLAGYAIEPAWAADHATWFTLATAGLPALGSAIYGIRVHGEFGAAAHRSLDTVVRLSAVTAALRSARSFPHAVTLAETAARLMLADLDQWRQTHQSRDLAIP